MKKGGRQRLRGCCGDLRILEISGGSVITCSSGSCKWSVIPFTNPNPVYSHSLTPDVLNWILKKYGYKCILDSFGLRLGTSDCLL
jgi:hypothetical protein